MRPHTPARLDASRSVGPPVRRASRVDVPAPFLVHRRSAGAHRFRVAPPSRPLRRFELRPRPNHFRSEELTDSSPTPQAKSKAANRRTQSLDREVMVKRAECEAALKGDVECLTTAIEFDNCVLRCVSHRCYRAVYGDDALEDGEVDTQRGRTFRSCSRTELRESKQRDMEQVRIAAAGEREDNL
jgi:hypothetical protein